MSRRIMIFGSNTGVGKTVFSALLSDELKGKGYKIAYIKPIQTGYPNDDDSKYVRNITGLSEEDAFCILKEHKPVAPAAIFESIPIDEIDRVLGRFDNYDFLVIETAGGICSPVDKRLLNFHLSKLLKVEYNVIVIPHRLGCINDALLVDYLAKKEGIDCCFAMNDFFESNIQQKNIELINWFSENRVCCRFKDKIEWLYELM